jgi:hypothetical protein
VFEARLPDLCQVPVRFHRHRAMGAAGAGYLRRVQTLRLMTLGYPLVNEGWRLNVDPELV